MLPRYYCPVGIHPPGHMPRSTPRLGLLQGKGPDVGEQGPGGGAIYGGPYVEDEPGWIKTDAGWWLHAGDCLPQDLVRMDPPPRVLRWTAIAGANLGDFWRVPVLIEPDPESIADGKPQMYRTALDRVWNGSSFSAPRDLIGLCERLLRLSLRINDAESARAGTGRAALSTIEAVELATEILAQGHAVSRHELVARGWLGEAVILRAILGAGDVPLVARAEAG